LPETAALIAGLILERPLCLDCLATKATLSPTVIERTLATVSTVMVLNRTNGRCRACGETKEVLALKRPDR
jgi:hypothetical protein